MANDSGIKIDFDENDALVDDSQPKRTSITPIENIRASSSGSDETVAIPFDEEDIVIPGKKYSMPESFKMGAERGLTLDFADELKGAINQGLSTGQDVFHKLGIAKYPSPYTYDEQLGLKSIDPYIEARDEARKEYKEAYEQNPVSSFSGMIVGGALTLPLTPAKIAAPLGSVGKMAPVLTKEFAKQAGKSAINSIPLSIATGIGGSEADNITDLGKDVGIAAGAGMVLSPALEKIGQVASNKLLKSYQDFDSTAVDKHTGGVWAKFKAGYSGDLQFSGKTNKKISDALDTIINKTRDKALFEKAKLDFDNNENIRIAEENILGLSRDKENLQQKLGELKYQQSVFSKTRKDENSVKAAQLLDDEIAKIENNINSVENEIKVYDDSITKEIESSKQELAEMMKQYDEHISAQENYYKNEVKVNKEGLDLNKNIIEELTKEQSNIIKNKSETIARDLQNAAANDLYHIKLGLDDVQSRYNDAGVSFNLKNPIKDFVKSLKKSYGNSQDEALSSAVNKIEKSLEPYKNLNLDANGVSQFKYGNDEVRSVIDKDIKDLFPQNRVLDKTFTKLVKKLENDIDETKYFQTQQFGKGTPESLKELVEDDKTLRKAYANLKYNDPYKLSETNKAIVDAEFNNTVVNKLQDLGDKGNKGVNKGSDLYKFLDLNSELMPSVNLVKQQDLEKYLKDLQDIRNTKSSIERGSNVFEKQAKLLEDKLNEIKLNKNQPVENLTPVDREFNDRVSYLQGKVDSLAKEPASNKVQLEKKLQELQELKKKKVISPKVQGEIDYLQNEIRNLNLDPKSHPEYRAYDSSIADTQSSISEIENKILELNKQKNRIGKATEPFYKTTKEQLLNTPEDQFNSKIRNLVFGREGYDGLGGKQQRLDKILSDFGLKNDKDVVNSLQTIEKLEPLIDQNKMSNIGLNVKGNIYGDIMDFVGTGANILGYVVGSPERITKPLRTSINKGLESANVLPTKVGMKSIDEILSSISGKSINDVSNMDNVSKAALRNSLLQMSPEIRQYLENKEREGNK